MLECRGIYFYRMVTLRSVHAVVRILLFIQGAGFKFGDLKFLVQEDNSPTDLLFKYCLLCSASCVQLRYLFNCYKHNSPTN